MTQIKQNQASEHLSAYSWALSIKNCRATPLCLRLPLHQVSRRACPDAVSSQVSSIPPLGQAYSTLSVNFISRSCLQCPESLYIAWSTGPIIIVVKHFWGLVVSEQYQSSLQWEQTLRGSHSPVKAKQELMHMCYVTVGMFARCGLGSLSKYTEWSVLGSGFEY